MVEKFLEALTQASLEQKRVMLEQLKRRSAGADLTKIERKELRSVYRHELVRRSAPVKIIAAWLVTVPASGLIAALIYYMNLRYGACLSVHGREISRKCHTTPPGDAVNFQSVSFREKQAMKSGKPDYIELVRKLSAEEQERLLSRMTGKLPRRLEKDKLTREEAMAIQMELEDEQLEEWRARMRALNAKAAEAGKAKDKSAEAKARDKAAEAKPAKAKKSV